jgi:hypothetical protein
VWKRNFLFKATEPIPLEQSENELFHDAEPAMDSAGLKGEKFLSVWVQGEGDDDAPTVYTNVYVRTAMLDPTKKTGLLQPLQGRTHHIKQMLTPGQKAYLKHWLQTTAPEAWDKADEWFKAVFELD